jgi:hypothetical protein
MSLSASQKIRHLLLNLKVPQHWSENNKSSPLLRNILAYDSLDSTAFIARHQPTNNSKGIIFSAWSTEQQMNSNRGTVFSEEPMPWLHNEDQLPLERILEMADGREEVRTEMLSAWQSDSSSSELVVGQSAKSMQQGFC